MFEIQPRKFLANVIQLMAFYIDLITVILIRTFQMKSAKAV